MANETSPPDPSPPGAPEPAAPRAERLRELAAIFFWLGLTSFGGPAAHVARMEAELVERRRWLSREAFVDLIGLTQLIPGPNSTEMAIHIGRLRAGLPGLVVAGSAFILPAALIVGALASLYARFGRLPELSGPLGGLKPVVVAIVVDALVKLAPSTLKGKAPWALALGAAAANLLGAPELAVVAAAGALSLALSSRAAPPAASVALPLWPVPKLLLAAAAKPAASSLFLFFLKVGSVLYGSGYVLLAFLRAGLVEQRGWLTEAQLIDATAVGQVTPGPVFTTATFIGYLLGGPSGAAAATAGIFLPAFVFVALTGALLPRLLSSRAFRAFLDGVNAASLALLAVVALRLAQAAVVGPLTAAIGLASLVLLRATKINSVWLLLAGAAAGYLSR